MDFYTWRDNVVGSLLGLSDLDYQRLAWTGAISSADGTPEEMLCTLVDDWAFMSFAADNMDRLSIDQVHEADLLAAAVRRYQKNSPDFDGNVDQTISDEAWLGIVAAARRLYVALCPSDFN